MFLSLMLLLMRFWSDGNVFCGGGWANPSECHDAPLYHPLGFKTFHQISVIAKLRFGECATKHVDLYKLF